MISIVEFCDKHDACEEGVLWAVENCKDMLEVWDTAPPEWLVWVASKQGVLSKEEYSAFGMECARQVLHLVPPHVKAAFESGAAITVKAPQDWARRSSSHWASKAVEYALRGNAWHASWAADLAEPNLRGRQAALLRKLSPNFTER